MHNPTLTKNFTAGGVIAARRIVQVGRTVGQVIQADAASDTTQAERPLGISDELGAKAASGRIDVHLAGIADVEAAGAVPYGATVKADSQGQAVATTAANDFVVGIALDAATTAGDLIPVLIAPQRI